MSLRVTIREIQKKIVMTYKKYSSPSHQGLSQRTLMYTSCRSLLKYLLDVLSAANLRVLCEFKLTHKITNLKFQ